MTNRERVIEAINFRKTDFIPHHVDFTYKAHECVAKALGESYFATINNHLTMTDMGKPQIEIKEGFFQDEFGVLWNKTGADRDIGVPDTYLINDWEDWDNYRIPPVDSAFIRKQCEALLAGDKDNFRGIAIGFSLFERLWTLMGMENALCAMLDEPELVDAILSKICERNLEIIDIALSYDIDFVHFGDDWGQQNGLIMGPVMWRQFIKPHLSRMYNRAKEAGKYVSQHSCGDIRLIMDDLIEMGLNIYQTFQPEIYGLSYSEKLRGHIAIWGGISTQQVLPYKTASEVRDITCEILQHFREFGGLIASPTHAIPADVPVENIAAMIDVFLHQDLG